MEPITELRRTTPPSRDALTLEEAKKHLELGESTDEHNAHLAALIAAATEQWEHDSGEALVSQSLTGYWPAFPCDPWLTLPVGPVTAVTSISYYDDANVLQVWDPSNYSLSAGSLVTLAYNVSWPSTYGRPDAVVIEWVAGYGADNTAVPKIVKQALLLQVGKWFADREMLASNLIYNDDAYERLVRRNMRRGYP
jgi:uncharacterized phiE125 gp8 family phage protein